MATNKKRAISPDDDYARHIEQPDTRRIEDSQLRHYLAQEHSDEIHNPRKRQKKDLAQEFCSDCTQMLIGCLAETRIENGRAGHIRALEISTLAISEKSCGLCAILASILRGHHGVLMQTRDMYRGRSSNHSSQYDDNGISDVDEITNSEKRVEITLLSNPKSRPKSYFGDPKKTFCTSLSLQFKVTIRNRNYRRKKSNSSIVKTDKATELITLNDELTLFHPPATLTESYDTSGPHPNNSFDINIETTISELAPDERLENEQKLPCIQMWLKESLERSQGKLKYLERRVKSFKLQFEQSKGYTALLKTRLEQSERALEQCKERIGKMPTLPARLLDLSTKGIVKLIQCSTLSNDKHPGFFQHEKWPSLSTKSPIYVALSHRWGASQHSVLTSETEKQWREGMPLDRLPKTFRDAVFVAQYFGVFLIWIDALAIIQDSEEDWKQESAKMGDVYLNAIFTIAVHSAEDDSEGFLAAALQKREAVIQHLHSQPVGIYRPPNPATDVTQSGLAKRGWVLQERMLASRTLHFTRGQIYMEDFAGIECERGKLREISKLKIAGSENPGNLFLNRSAGSSILSPSELPELRRLFHRRRDLAKGHIQIKRSIEWLNLVEMYSRCDLTKDTDRLMAITGLARKILVATSMTWCAGIWSQYICKGLLWLPTKTGLIRPSTIKAPSWSWAYWEGPIQYPRSFQSDTSSFQERCNFVSVSSQNGEPTTWLNTPGCIVLQGRLLSLARVRFQRQQLLGPGVFKGSPTQISLAYHVDAHGLFADGMLIGWAIFDTPLPTLSESVSAFSFDNTSDYEFAFLILGELKTVLKTSFLGICLRRPLHSQGPYTRVAFAEMNDRFFSTNSEIATTINVKRYFSAAWVPGVSRYRAVSWDELLFDEADMTKVTIE